MALKVALEKQQSNADQLIQKIVACVSQLKKHHYKQRGGYDYNNNKQNQDQRDRNPYHQPWMTTSPDHPSYTKVVDRKVFSWCSRCRQGKGLWVSHHNIATHVDGYRNQRRRQGDYNHQVSADKSWQPTSHLPPTPSAQMLILDYLGSYLPPPEHESQHDPSDSEE
jgi:hypothetical protein